MEIQKMIKKAHFVTISIMILLSLMLIHIDICHGNETDECKNNPSVSCVKKRDYIIAGVRADIPLFGYLDRDDKSHVWKGFEVDLMREFAQCWLKSGTKVKFIDVPAGDRPEYLDRGLVDLMAGTYTHTHEREARIDFSQTYFRDRKLALLVRKSDLGSLLPRYGRFEDIAKYLTAKKGITPRGTTLVAYFKEESAKLSIKIPPLSEGQNYKMMADNLVQNNDVDFVVGNEAILKGYERYSTDLVVVGITTNPPAPSEPEESYGIGIRKNNEALRKLINVTLQELAANGKYQELFEKWFDDPELWPLYKMEVYTGGRSFAPFENSCNKGALAISKPPPAAPAARIASVVTLPIMEDKIPFASGHSLSEAALERVEAMMNKASSHAPQAIVIAGYADKTGTDAVNRSLSQQRAEAVKLLFLKKGYQEAMITAKGCGQDNSAPKDKPYQNSRRVDVKFIFTPQVVTVCQ